MSQHTPGPWRTYTHGRGIEILGDSNGISSVVVARLPQEIMPTDASWAIAEENARLIAAAPDLLAALEMMADYLDGESDGPSISEADQVRAAIAKAKGERT